MNTIKINRSQIYKYIKVALLLIWALLAFAYLERTCHYSFFYREQNQLFLMSQEYLTHYFEKPSWFACMMGDFLTQFFYYIYAGASITTLSLLVFGHFLNTSLGCISRNKIWRNCIFAISLILMTFGAHVCLQAEQHIHCVVSLTTGILFWLCGHSISRILKSHTIRIAFILIAFILACWSVGYGSLMIIILETAWCLAYMKKTRKYLSIIFPLLLCFAFIIENNLFAKCYNVMPDDCRMSPSIDYVSDREKCDTKEQLLAYDNEYYFGNYSKVADMYEKEGGKKIDEMCFFYCLSLAQMNMLPDKLMTMKNPNLGTFLKIGPDTPMFTIKMINELYYLIGDMTYTERAALLANTFSKNGRNARMIKRIAEANIINGDTIAAKKYLRLLEKTIVYKDWAKAHMPETMSPRVKEEMEYKRQFINKSDRIRLGDDCYIILTQLLDSNKDNTIALDYLLCSDIVARQRDTFMSDYEKYGPRNKRLYHEALNK